MNRIITLAKAVIKWVFITLGIILAAAIILSFTDLPYYAYHHLGTVNSSMSDRPDVIVVLGGSGMPSPDGLIRAYYASESANEFESAEIVIALPYNEKDSLYQLNLMAHELIIRGVDSLRIKYEPFGFNTHSQAIHVASMFADWEPKPVVLLITSPEHMYRSVRSFIKAGFVKVGGIAAFERPSDEGMLKDRDKSKDTRIKQLSLRYNMWSYLKYELLVLREYMAIIYYKMKGWV